MGRPSSGATDTLPLENGHTTHYANASCLRCSKMLQIVVERNDIAAVPCDVLVLKYAQRFHGADAEVAANLNPHGRIEIDPKPGRHTYLPSKGLLAARHVLFMGVVPLANFDYSEIRAFSARGLATVASEIPDAMHIGMTIHGVNYGLDERESFLAQLGGFMDAGRNAGSIERVTIIEKDSKRAERLQAILQEAWHEAYSGTTGDFAKHRITAGVASRDKPHVFVAMPFSKPMQDVYIFGIQGPANAAGYLCERVDMTTFTGDILARIKSRIDTAALVIADLTGGNPNVYLEVGYAWGRNRHTLLLAREGDDLKFDVRGQRCIHYESIADLAEKLAKDLLQLGHGGAD